MLILREAYAYVLLWIWTKGYRTWLVKVLKSMGFHCDSYKDIPWYVSCHYPNINGIKPSEEKMQAKPLPEFQRVNKRPCKNTL